ncbi:MAG: SDR family oxidoreductase [Hyphomicrobiales bacterium]|nr:SDR family oxidoreductase [Hyphomicrobiales bacterium]
MSARIALVTGASAGIGKACAIALAKAGFDVALAARRRDALDAAAREIEATGRRALPIVCDVGDPAQVTAMFESVRENFGRLDFLFNNAGVFAPPLPLEDLSYAQWKSVVDANLTGVFLCMQGAFRLMRDQTPRGGRIVNNGSISAHAPRPNSAPYTATKHAVTGLTRAGALDGRKYDIAVGQIDIGNADTAMAGPMKTGVAQADGSTRVEAVMDVSHVADAVTQMALLPLEANILFMTVMATKMPFVGRG